MEIVVISREVVKPSTPTPISTHEYQLSFLDQMNGQIFAPMLYFYPSKSDLNVDKSKILKESLSETLIKYYPLAGRLRKCFRYIDCTDEGVELTEAKINCKLSQILAENTNLALYNELLPHHSLEYAGNIPMLVQLNFFECGGLVIAMRFNHKIMDALSITRFMNHWATITRRDGTNVMVQPRLDLSRLIPPRNIPDRGFDVLDDTFVGKRFVFSKDAISILRDRYTTRHLRPTRVEAVATFILCRFVAATYLMANPRKSFEVAQAANLCNRMNPPILGPYIGNLYGNAAVTITLEKGTTEEAFDFLTRMRTAIRKVDNDYVNNFQEELYLRKRERKNEKNLVEFSFSSLAGFPIYEADFGWGKPIWFTSGKDPMDTTVTFHPTRSRDGIEAIVKLRKNDMVKLESDAEFMAFISQNSSAELKFLSSL